MADRHLGEVDGFSVLEIVRNNPKEKIVHFGGIKGHGIRQRYMEMSYQTTDKEGNVKTLPLFGDIDLRTSRYTFSSPTGLLCATQFTQIALVVTEKAAFEDLREKGLVQEGAPFAGHSLGVYSALASIAGVLPIPSLVDVVFFRGITMQHAVEQDEQTRSKCAMAAINPSRIGKSFSDAALQEAVDTISKRCQVLLEIVNFNVEGRQYVTAGELVLKIDIAELQRTLSHEKVKEHLTEIVDECHKESLLQEPKQGFIVPERGFAADSISSGHVKLYWISSIPLPGIDIPFHSRYLWAGVMPFRAYLSKKLNPAHMNPELLIDKYILNLTAQPFQISKAYTERIYQQANSPRPVLWIQTQHQLFSHHKYNIKRLIEFGPSPTLTGMASRTLKLKFDKQDTAHNMSRKILCISKNIKEIYYQYEDEVEAEAAPPSSNESTVASPVAVAASSGPVTSVADEPLQAVKTLRVLAAQGLKKPLSDVPLSKVIKDLVGGKSTLQNELLGSAQAEFGLAPDKAEEMPLGELGAALQSSYNGTIGKHMSGLVPRLVGSKMPGGFGMLGVKGHLSKSWGLGPGRTKGRPVGAAGGSAGGAVVNSEEFKKFQQSQDAFVSQQLEVLLRYLKKDSRDGYRLHDLKHADDMRVQDELDSIQKEHGKAISKASNQPIMNRANPALIDYMQYYLDHTDASKGERCHLAKEFGQMLLSNCREAIGTAPLYRDVYEEVNGVGVSRLERYVTEMAAGSKITAEVNLDKVQESIQNLYKLIRSQPTIAKSQMAVEPTALSGDKTPLLHLKRIVGNNWVYSSKLTIISSNNAVDFKVVHGIEAEAIHHPVKISPRANFTLPMPKLRPNFDNEESENLLRGMLDLEKVIVIAGYAEVGPIEGLLELATITGLIKFVKNGKQYVGWVDAQTEEPVDDSQVKSKYEAQILAHTGVRFIGPELFRGDDSKRKGYTQEIELNHDLQAIKTSQADAEKFKLQHGDKNAKIMIPKAVRFDRLVAGQIPTGWDALMAGITDPYELYKYIYPSRVGSSLGSGMCGMSSLSKMFRDRREEKNFQKDIPQETFINTVAGRVNLLLLSSSGPIKIPVGACAIALQSVEIACDTILSGMIAGGFDNFDEEGSLEFANIQAISNTETELAAGREPHEMFRSTTSTRARFIESQGCGVQVLMSAKTAIEIGASIYGIVAYTATITDKAGRSVPAPGCGVLSTAREAPGKVPAPSLDIKLRKRQLAFRRMQISQLLEKEIDTYKSTVSKSGQPMPSDEIAERYSAIEKGAKRQEKEAQSTFGMPTCDAPAVAPLRRALAVWEVNIDDIGVESFQGTSTKANDKEASELDNRQFWHLG
ncbi:hypothetical protein PSHT_01075 [Puccinia striiformis]|uniref:Carrier domain-containing protein n=1 Tax=Puccinia striiformis TaxID=27350 RepID=A0A2S4WLH1_9BASI|nr:hypothetical protein PSHT_01075 [Puccinia striiformis]